LIVDDEFGLAEMMRDMLREYGYDVILAINGRLALDALQERSVDLIITDLMMPVMDGLELAGALRSNEALRGLPIILMTSLPSAPAGTERYDAVLRKPFTPDLLLTTIRECLMQRGNNGSGEDGSGPAANKAEPEKPAKPRVSGPIHNLADGVTDP
jgi:CheY-like chemotaxis protein